MKTSEEKSRSSCLCILKKASKIRTDTFFHTTTTQVGLADMAKKIWFFFLRSRRFTVFSPAKCRKTKTWVKRHIFRTLCATPLNKNNKRAAPPSRLSLLSILQIQVMPNSYGLSVSDTSSRAQTSGLIIFKKVHPLIHLLMLLAFWHDISLISADCRLVSFSYLSGKEWIKFILTDSCGFTYRNQVMPHLQTQPKGAYQCLFSASLSHRCNS